MSSLPPKLKGSILHGKFSHFFILTCSNHCTSGQISLTHHVNFLLSRYGSMFKSHILGCPCVMISSPEAAKFVLNKAQLFKPTFPASKERMLGKQAIFFHQGEYHANLRRLVLRTFMPEAIKNIVPDIESIAQDSLKSWEGRLITTFLEMKTVSPPKQSLSVFSVRLPYENN